MRCVVAGMASDYALPSPPHRHSRESGNPVSFAFATTSKRAEALDSRFHGNDGEGVGSGHLPQTYLLASTRHNLSRHNLLRPTLSHQSSPHPGEEEAA